MNIKKACIFGSVALTTTGAIADFAWEWGGESGMFITAESGGDAGTYTIVDFEVTSSALGAVSGSASNGDYSIGGLYQTNPTFTFDWDGSAVTNWYHEGENDFDWHVYFTPTGDIYQFGWDTDNNNDHLSAGFTSFSTGASESAPVTVSFVPAPSGVAFFGAAGLLGTRRRRRSC